MKKAIVLATANARYSHCAFGLRWLFANLGELNRDAVIREFTIQDPADRIVQALLDYSPRLVGFGVYIWNVTLLTEVVQRIKSQRPEIVVVIGGPEVWYEYEDTAIFQAADYLVRGEGETGLGLVVARVFAGQPPDHKVIDHPPAGLGDLEAPYQYYTDEDIAQRVLYVESSRGCPFLCEFCLSSRDSQVREHSVTEFLGEMSRLLQRGARQFKFVDRTFNLRQSRVNEILRFFLERRFEGLRLHFEVVPDLLTPETLALFAEFPPGVLHLEAGIQSFNPETLAAISRRQDRQKTLENLTFLRRQTGALLHVDLVAGLPAETWDSFAAAFDATMALQPHELQVGVLKRLKGAPISRHAAARTMSFNAAPPYEVLETDLLDAASLDRIKRFARYFNVYYNADNFPSSCPLIWHNARFPFAAFMQFADFVWEQTQRTYGLPLVQSARLLFAFLVGHAAIEPETAARSVESDFHGKPGRKEKLDLHPGRVSKKGM